MKNETDKLIEAIRQEDAGWQAFMPNLSESADRKKIEDINTDDVDVCIEYFVNYFLPLFGAEWSSVQMSRFIDVVTETFSKFSLEEIYNVLYGAALGGFGFPLNTFYPVDALRALEIYRKQKS